MPPEGFELAVLASEKPQTHDLDCAATGAGITFYLHVVNYKIPFFTQELQPRVNR